MQSRGESIPGTWLARGLGWFSLALGATQVVGTDPLARAIGIDAEKRNLWLLRGLGMRELAVGIPILARHQPAMWIWARVAGDAVDLALLGMALRGKTNGRSRLAAATAAVAGVTGLDVLDAVRLSRTPDRVNTKTGAETSPELLEKERAKSSGLTLTIRRPVDEVRQAWEQQPGHLRERLEHVRFVPAPGNRGTEIHAQLRQSGGGSGLTSLASGAASAVTGLFGAAESEHSLHDLRAFKARLEAGEAPVSAATLHRMPHPAIPPTEIEVARAQRAA